MLLPFPRAAAALLSTLLAITSLLPLPLAHAVAPSSDFPPVTRGRPKPIPPPVPLPPSSMRTVAAGTATSGVFSFEQLLDHDRPWLGKFGQRVWWNAEFWGGPGSPVVFFTPGEIAADAYGGYLTNSTLTGTLAQEIKGAVVMVEHRYWGDSSPYDDLTGYNLRFLTLRNSIADFVRIAKTARFPFDPTNQSNSAHAPWIMIGGSYSGSLSAWTESTSPGTFWAYHASSAPVEAVYDYWQYFQPVEKAMPRNCSRDVSAVIDYVDTVFAYGSPRAKQALKDKFGLGKLQDDDVGNVLQNGPWQEQNLNFYSPSPLTVFCDTVEGVESGALNVPAKEGVGLAAAIEGYAYWVREIFVPRQCQAYGYEDALSTECFDTHNPQNKIFTNREVRNNIDRQWQWMLCNEPFGWWQGAPPRSRGGTNIVSRTITAEYFQRQCSLFFPPSEGKHGSSLGRTTNDINRFSRGWSKRSSKRLLYTNGELDPWRSSGVSSEFRPGGPLENTDAVPVHVIPGGYHCSDLQMQNYEENEEVRVVVDKELEILKGWVAEWYVGKPRRGARRRWWGGRKGWWWWEW